jgi:hypothetical protein
MTQAHYALRVATLDDAVAATRLLSSVGLVMPQGDAAAVAHWSRLWRDNPALAHDGADPLPGWVLEADGRMVGFFGNYGQVYWQGERKLKVAIASQWGVEKPHRAATQMVSDAYFAQPHADMILVTTGIKATGRLFDRYGGTPVPQAGLDRVGFWVTSASGFGAATLRKKGWKGAGLAGKLAWLAAGPVRLTWPKAPRQEVEVTAEATFGPRFDALFAAMRRDRPNRLFADRGALSLAWHTAPHAARDGLRVLSIGSGDVLRAYALMVRDDAPAIGLARWRLADMLAVGDDPALVADLLGAAVRVAAKSGGHVLEVGGMAAEVAAAVERAKPLYRPLPTWPCFFRMSDGQTPPEAWYLSAYDGDTVLF